MRIHLQLYYFTIKYKLKKELAIVDSLSRSFLEEKHDPFEGEIEVDICVINPEIIMSDKEKVYGYKKI